MWTLGPGTEGEAEGRARIFQVRGHQWAWEVQEGSQWDFKNAGGPARIEVNRGDEVTLVLLSTDVTHGFSLPAYKLNATLNHIYPVTLTFVADEAGRFTFRCHMNCGSQHPYMVGILVVRPNNLLPAGLVGVMALGLAGAAWGLGQSRVEGIKSPNRAEGLDLLERFPRLRKILVDRRPQFALQALLLAGFGLVIFTGLVGLQNGAHNLAVVGVWLIWWFLLVAVVVPLMGRAWCGICPLPLPGEWLARRRVLGPGQGGPAPDHRPSWPLRKWGLLPAYGLLLGMGAISMVLTTSPRVSGLAFLGLLVLATLVTVRYRGRAFCHCLCPIAPFLRLYSRLAPLTLEAHDSQSCTAHRTKECLQGADSAWGCPWDRYVAAPHGSADCGLCLECLRACSKNNVTIRLRPARPTLERGRLRNDEIFGAALLMGLLVTYQLVLMGPYSTLKGAAGMNDGPWAYLLYLGLLVNLALGVLPALLAGVARLGRTLGPGADERQLRGAAAMGLLPLGLAGWVAFKFPVILTNWVYLPRIASDPLGWGWNLWGTAHTAGGPLLVGWIIPFQVGLVLLGLLCGARLTTVRVRLTGLTGRRLAGALTPLLLFLGTLAALLIWLFGG